MDGFDVVKLHAQALLLGVIAPELCSAHGLRLCKLGVLLLVQLLSHQLLDLVLRGSIGGVRKLARRALVENADELLLVNVFSEPVRAWQLVPTKPRLHRVASVEASAREISEVVALVSVETLVVGYAITRLLRRSLLEWRVRLSNI